MWLILRGEPEAVTSHALLLLGAGFLLMGLSVVVDQGGIVGFFLFALGSMGAALSEWRKERGLWMLAVLFLVIYDAIYLIVCVEQITDIWRGVRPDSIALVLDFSIGLLFLLATVRFLFKVAKANYRVSRETHADD